MRERKWSFGILMLLLSITTFMLNGCGNGGGGNGGGGNGGGGGAAGSAAGGGATRTGGVSIKVAYAPGLGYQNVWVTITGIWFHVSPDAGDVTYDPGWVKADLPAPVTVDLAALTSTNLQSLISKTLPSGTYKQIRVFLASTEAQPSVSARAGGLLFNNEIRLINDPMHYPLRIPAAEGGIKLIPDTPVVISATDTANFAFTIAEDVVQTRWEGAGGAADSIEFVLKPRLVYFDLNNAAAITGSIAPPAPFTFANYTGKDFVVMAEQPDFNGNHRLVRRSTTIMSDGSFTLYPLPILRNATTATYDVLLRGRNVQTRIVTGVKVHKGTTTANGCKLGPAITMTRNTTPEYLVQTNVTPAGSWVYFYQTLPSDPSSYEVRVRHVDPYSKDGTFSQAIELSSDPLQVAPWNNGAPLNFTTMTPVEGSGSFTAVAQAIFYESSVLPVTPLTTTLLFGALTMSAPATPRQVTGTIQVPATMNLNHGAIFSVNGGIIVNRLDVDSLMAAGSNGYIFGNLPGGTPASPLPGAIYDLIAVGWNAKQPLASKVIAGPGFADLRSSDWTGKANFPMPSL